VSFRVNGNPEISAGRVDAMKPDYISFVLGFVPQSNLLFLELCAYR